MPRLRTCQLAGDPVSRGARHGAAFADGIRAYTEERVRLACSARWAGVPLTRDRVLGLAEAMIPAHRLYDTSTFDEMEAMARAAGISVAEAIVVGGFTDFVDALRAHGPAPVEDDCTSVIVPPNRAGGTPLYAQTWDMHQGATGHVVLFDVRPESGLASWIFTTVGCVGQIGVNDAGISIGIDNLTCVDGRPGVTWPFVVRKVLAQTTLETAIEAIRSAQLCGGHAYHLLSADGRGAMVEATSTTFAIWPLEADVLTHTNHALSADVRPVEGVRAPELVQSSFDRLARARALCAGVLDRGRLADLTADPVICRKPEPPFDFETSGAVITAPRTRELWAVWGRPADGVYERFVVGEDAP
jgi:isopenicillin-N N-acyltransferase-like protein